MLTREGRTLATYGLASGPQGYRPLREFLVAKLKRDAGIACTADEILVTSGSLQALDLVNGILLARGDTVLIEQETYQGSLNRCTRLGVNAVGIPLDRDGMRMDALAAALDDLKRRGIRPKYIYTIPTVQNPTGTILPRSAPPRDAAARATARRADLRGRLLRRPDLGRQPAACAPRDEPAAATSSTSARSRSRSRRRCASATSWPTGASSRACWRSRPTPAPARSSRWCWPNSARRISTTHVPALTRGLRAKLETLMDALAEQFGTAAEFDDPKGGIFLWVKLPDDGRYAEALSAGARGRRRDQSRARNGRPTRPTRKGRMRLCFASPSHETIRARRRGARRGVPQGVRRAGADRQCGAGEGLDGHRALSERSSLGRCWTPRPCNVEMHLGAHGSTRTGDVKPLHHLTDVLDLRRRGEAVGDVLAPLLEVGRAAKVDGVVFHRRPFDEQPVAVRLLDRPCSSRPWQPLARWNTGVAFLTPVSNSVSMPSFTSIWAISMIMFWLLSN